MPELLTERDARSTQPLSKSSVTWLSLKPLLESTAPGNLNDPSNFPLLQLYRSADHFALAVARSPHSYINRDGQKLTRDYLFRVLMSAFAEKVSSEPVRRSKESLFEAFHNALIHGHCTLE